jgi:hypothetical protein
VFQPCPPVQKIHPPWLSSLLAVILLTLAACRSGVSPSPAVTVPAPDPTSTPTSLPPTAECQSESASVELVLSAETLQVGDTLQAQVIVHNQGCLALGLPQYRLSLGGAAPETVFSPAPVDPLVYFGSVSPGSSHRAEFNLVAVSPGEVEISASVSYEVHLGYPGPAYWGQASSGAPQKVTVAP